METTFLKNTAQQMLTAVKIKSRTMTKTMSKKF